MMVAVALTDPSGVANEMEPGPFPTGPLFANSTVLPLAPNKDPEYDVVPEVQEKVVVVGPQVIASVGFAAPPGATRIALTTRAKSAASVSLCMPSPLCPAAAVAAWRDLCHWQARRVNTNPRRGRHRSRSTRPRAQLRADRLVSKW